MDLIIMEKHRMHRTKETRTHVISHKKIKGQYLIKRMKAPCIDILYNPGENTGVMFSRGCGVVGSKIYSETEIDAAFRKAVAWARNTIIN